jgi:hypothetical protein
MAAESPDPAAAAVAPPQLAHDVFRQVGHDERVHGRESEARMNEPRFR